MTLIIGLTGGIASGKSTVSTMLKEMDIQVIDADIEARLAVQKGEQAYKKIIAEFGEDILMDNGEIDRKKLGAIIFHDEDKRQTLNGIVHPEVRKRMMTKIEEAKKNQEEIIVLDIPLLFESKLTYLVDKTILVYVDLETQLKRLMARNQLTVEEAKARINSQMPLVDKIRLADAVIDNNGSIDYTRKQLLQVLSEWGFNKANLRRE
ncbi:MULTISPECIES: dephospho-CoA kinase [Neobacillus]|jgi:dephospho-CoA kinase|uniref:Dephospho-CoA kinase n=1 Tax=Neobacillus sedimentimangrovi TaxID=2699460 RepID=A0ABS8QMH3_9BACI|nr:dephospho-CoA kinase [Neobacillus sedimentimangrovi]AIM15859.1 dephospho-CoA kinase [Bacillus sp. X1(2014)]MCD4840312.1 dephospho-CoA kinase [Neobacillus sedimentimangrovi]